jgi:predicted transport protein
VTKIGHFGTGYLEVAIGSTQDLERAQPLIQMSYQVS